MKKIFIILISLISVMAVIPVAVNIDYLSVIKPEKEDSKAAVTVSSQIISNYRVPQNITYTDISINKEKNMSFKSFLRSVIGAAVEGDFLAEEIKSLTVAYQTQLCYNADSSGIRLDVTDKNVFLTEAELKEKFGGNLTTLYSYIENVSGIIITSGGKPCNLNISTFSDTNEENPAIPLTASPYNAVNNNYITLVTFSEKDFIEKINNLEPSADTGDPQQLVGDISYNNKGNVSSVIIGGKKIDGSDIAKEFSLPTSRYTVVYKSGSFTFTVMQNNTVNMLNRAAARRMAEQSNTYEEILNYFYP